MRIIRLDRHSDQKGKALMSASTFIVRRELCDEYTVTFEAQGLDAKGDPLTYRLTMTRNELRTLNRFADLAKEA